MESGLDLLVSESVPVGFSQMFIEAVMMDPNERLGRTLSLKTPSAALALTQTMYLTDGSPVQWSRDTFRDTSTSTSSGSSTRSGSFRSRFQI